MRDEYGTKMLPGFQTYQKGNIVHFHHVVREDDGEYHDHIFEVTLDDSVDAVILEQPLNGATGERSDCSIPGHVFDVSHYWETTENYVIHDGKLAVGLTEAAEERIDHWIDLYMNCFVDPTWKMGHAREQRESESE